ncbi:MAG: hypothetical protein ABH822_02050 [Patescibacteria group bacterium]
MVAKLKSVWKNQISQLAFKAAIFGLLLLWFGYGHSLPAAAALVVGVMWLYFKPFFNPVAMLRPFSVFLILAFWTTTVTFSYIAVVFLAFLFFVILGLKNLILVRRKGWRAFLDISLLYLGFLNFFLLDKSSLFFLKWGGFLVVFYLLFGDLLRTVRAPDDKVGVVGGVLTLIAAELLWVVSWLPIGFLASANLMILVSLLMVDLLAGYFKGKLRQKMIIKDLMVFLVLLAVVLLTSRWTL